MKTRAAVAFEAKKPLEIVELDLEGVNVQRRQLVAGLGFRF